MQYIKIKLFYTLNHLYAFLVWPRHIYNTVVELSTLKVECREIEFNTQLNKNKMTLPNIIS
jgi:hypothetical protein